MKPLTLFLSFLLLGFSVSGRKTDLLLYTNLGGGGGDVSYFKIGATAILNHKHSFTLLLGDYTRTAKDLPADYVPASTLFGSGDLYTDLQNVDVLYGRVLTTPNSQLIRLNFKIGLSMGRYTYPGNFVPYVDTTQSHSFFSLDFGDPANYTHTNIVKPVFGIVFNPTIEIPLTVPFGLSAGIYANINNRSSLARMEINILLGKVRNKARSNSVQ